ncbi:MAG: hypothetical protein JO257_23790 [Deltaproteobacteria bacterium]|nr:hypothetical protein [Deltaproteobacteria bacterium]
MVTSIKTIRMNQPTNGTAVTLKSVVVTGHVSSKKYGHVWVQDMGGGQYSGIQLFCNYGGTHPNCTMTQQQIDALAVGSVVDVSGMFSSFLLSTAPAGAQPNLEIDAPTITATGQTATPMAVDVDAATIAKAQLASAAADPYKGAYVHVTGGPFHVSTTTAAEFQAPCTGSNGSAGTTYNGFEAMSTSQTLAIGINFYNTLTYCLPSCGYPCTNPITNQTFTTVSGIVEPEYNGSNSQVYLQVSPPTDGDLH